jgi:carbon storage regulator CsrA
MNKQQKIGNLCITMIPGRAVKIGEDITVTMLEIRSGKQVRFLIQAPREVSVQRIREKTIDEKNDTSED